MGLIRQVVSDPATSRTQIKENLKNLAKGGVATVVEHGGTVLSSDQAGHSKDKAKEYAHNVKHYGAFAEDYLGFDDPNKELRKAVKAKEKAAKKARKAKKKAGKGKKGEDLFDPANLAKYKKELEEKRKAAEEAAAHDTDTDDEKAKSDAEDEAEGLKLDLARPTKDHHSPSSEENSAAPSPARSRVTSPKDDTEDWKKFLDLTSGVDSLIQKSKHELEEIKQDSYYQAKKEKLHDDTREAKEKRSKQKKKVWVDLDAEGFEDHDGEVFDEKEREKELAGEDSSSESEEGGEKVDLPEAGEAQEDEGKDAEESEEDKKKPELFKEPSVEEYVDPDEDDALFNTDFVTDITTGKVQLAVRGNNSSGVIFLASYFPRLLR